MTSLNLWTKDLRGLKLDGNSSHWVLDVSCYEDDCRIHSGNAPPNRALLRHVALSLLAQNKSTMQGIDAKRKKAAWDQAYLIKILTQ